MAGTPTPQATPANAQPDAENTFLARTNASSDQAMARAYLAAHPDEARSFGVDLISSEVQ